MDRIAIGLLPIALIAILASSAIPQQHAGQPAGPQQVSGQAAAADPVAKIDQQPWVSPTSTLAATTVVSGLLVWIVTRYLPATERRHAKDVTEAREAYAASLASAQAAFSLTLDKVCDRDHAREERHQETLSAITAALAELRVHCATKTG